MLDEHPGIVREYLTRLTPQSQTLLLLNCRSIYESICEVLLKQQSQNWKSEAVRLYQALKRTRSIINIVEEEIGLLHIDIVLFQSEPFPEIVELWNERLESCKTDFDLFELVLNVRASNCNESRDWLSNRIASDRASDFSFEVARAEMLFGLLGSADVITVETGERPKGPWPERVRFAAAERSYEEKQTKYWLEKFCTDGSDIVSWSSFQMLLQCVDRRIWLWIEEKLNYYKISERKKRFIQLNKSELENACKRNEDKLKQHFLECKVSDQLFPWLKDSLSRQSFDS